MATHFLDPRQVKQIDMVEYLQILGFEPQKIKNNDYWYLSPLREEKEASFKVNRKLNLWYDHGLGKGGSIIDFGMLYYKCSIPAFIQQLAKSFSFHSEHKTVQQHPANIQPQEALEPTIKVIAAKPLTNPILCRYLNERRIPVGIAERYCKEVYFEVAGRRNFAIGFENRSRGFELRNSLFKGSSSPKDITQITSPVGATEVAIFEGFFDFLSYQALREKETALTNFLILNSLSFFEKSREMMESYDKVSLYLDRDEAGMKNTEVALKWNTKYIDNSHFYKNHKDLNDYLVKQSSEHKHQFKLRRHF